MNDYLEARSRILDEILSTDAEVRKEYARHFETQARAFAEHMSHAFAAWRALDENTGKDPRLAYVVALVFTSINLHVQSMALFFAGQLVAAGNLTRQVVECIALALLCSERHLPFLQKFIDDEYSTNKAVRDVLANAKQLGLIEDAVKELERAQRFYHMYSHPSKLTIASVIGLPAGAVLYVGAAFDPGKVDFYEKEANGRTSLASVFVSFIEAVRANVAKW